MVAITVAWLVSIFKYLELFQVFFGGTCLFLCFSPQIPYTLPVGLEFRFYQLKRQSARNELIDNFRIWAQQRHGHIAETRYQLMSDGWSIIGVLGKGCMRRRCRMQGNLGAQRKVYHYESLSCGVSRLLSITR